MRRVSAFIALFVSLAVWAGPENVWLATDHDFGAFHEDLGKVNCVFKAVNTGDEPLSILDVRANCGCTTPQYSRDLVFPGDTAVINVGYNAIGRPGRFEKKIVVTTNAAAAPRTTLTIQGSVIGASNTLAGRYPIASGDLRLQSASIIYGDIFKPSCTMKYIECYNASSDTVVPTLVDLPKYMTAMVSPTKVPPGENFIVSTTFDSAVCPVRDVVQPHFGIAAGRDTVMVMATAIVKDDYSALTDEQLRQAPRVTLSPETIDLRTVSPADKPIQAKLTIGNGGHTPLSIYRIYTPDQAIGITLDDTSEIKPGKKRKATVTITPEKLAGRDLLDARVIIITNDPQTPRRIVRVVAEIKP